MLSFFCAPYSGIISACVKEDVYIIYIELTLKNHTFICVCVCAKMSSSSFWSSGKDIFGCVVRIKSHSSCVWLNCVIELCSMESSHWLSHSMLYHFVLRVKFFRPIWTQITPTSLGLMSLYSVSWWTASYTDGVSDALYVWSLMFCFFKAISAHLFWYNLWIFWIPLWC